MTTSLRIFRKVSPAVAVFCLGTLGVGALALGWPNLIIGADNNEFGNAFLQPQDPALSGGGRDQTLKFGDVVLGQNQEDLLIGRLGGDVLSGWDGNDTIVGGTEHFNPENRDRAFGGNDNDVFLWAPGDGSDFFDGGPGVDAVVFGLMGEIENGQLVFRVSNDQQAGEIYINPATGLPLVDVTNSPGFCEVVDDSTSMSSAAELDALGLDHLVRFFIRSAAQSFANGTQTTDNGLRVTLHLKDVEVLICTSEDGGEIEAFNLTTTPPTQVPLNGVYSYIPQLQGMIQ